MEYCDIIMICADDICKNGPPKLLNGISFHKLIKKVYGEDFSIKPALYPRAYICAHVPLEFTMKFNSLCKVPFDFWLLYRGSDKFTGILGTHVIDYPDPFLALAALPGLLNNGFIQRK